MTTKADLHQLVDGLPECNLPVAQRALQALQEEDSLLVALRDAPLDDEPLTEEDIAAIDAALEEVARGDVVEWDDYWARRAERG